MLALWYYAVPEDVQIEWDVRMGELAKPISQAKAAMAHAEADRQRRDIAVGALTEAGMSYRDVVS